MILLCKRVKAETEKSVGGCLVMYNFDLRGRRDMERNVRFRIFS